MERMMADLIHRLEVFGRQQKNLHHLHIKEQMMQDIIENKIKIIEVIGIEKPQMLGRSLNGHITRKVAPASQRPR